MLNVRREAGRELVEDGMEELGRWWGEEPEPANFQRRALGRLQHSPTVRTLVLVHCNPHPVLSLFLPFSEYATRR